MTLKQKHTAPESYIKIPMLCVKSGLSIDLCYSVSRNCRVDLLDQSLQYGTRSTFCEVGSTIGNHIFNGLCPTYRSSQLSNQILLDGYICKDPIYRKTPLGREIADLLVAVNRSYGKSDYIPCICWGRNARFAARFEVGVHVQIWGRIQSREYVKRLNEDEVEKRTAYEVSVSKIEYME